MHRSGFITILGWTNVGKSTLLNRLLGSKVAITSPKPQTTRNRIVGIKNIRGAQLVFVDTPGIHRDTMGKKLNRYMIDLALRSAGESDLILLIADNRPEAPEQVMQITAQITAKTGGKPGSVPVILALNKSDLIRSKPELLPMIESFGKIYPFAEIVPVSAQDGSNVDRLVTAIAKRLPEGPEFFPPDMVTDQPEDFFIAELIREQLFRRTHQEVPYSTAVVVEKTEEKPEKNLLVIYATVIVETESQKKIVVGSGGSMLKGVGTAARKEIERELAVKVFLDIRVKVRGKWSSNDSSLRDLGYRLKS